MRSSLSSFTSFPVPTEDLLLGDPQESLASLLLQQSMLVLGREMTVGPASLSCVVSLCRAAAQGHRGRAG